MLRRPIILAFAALFVISGAALAYAPYLPRLISEGYPPPVWPAPGAFARIEGAVSPAPVEARSKSSKWAAGEDLAQLFAAGGGRAFLVDRKGRLELEHYAEGVTQATKFNSYSMAKSLVGALIFRALAEGRLRSLDMPVGDILPDYGDAAFRAVTLRQLLNMRGGVLFERDDPIAAGQAKDVEAALMNPFGPMARLHALGLAAIRTQLTADAALRDRFRYQNVNTAILAAVLETLYRRTLADLLSEKLWRSAGAGDALWRQCKEGAAISAYCCIFATARDWIRIGRHLLRNGTPSEPFLPEPLWRELLGRDLDPASLHDGIYSYQFRHDVLDRGGAPVQGPFTYMLGQGGQILYLLPRHDLIVLRFGERMQLLHSTLYATWQAVGPPAAD